MKEVWEGAKESRKWILLYIVGAEAGTMLDKGAEGGGEDRVSTSGCPTPVMNGKAI